MAMFLLGLCSSPAESVSSPWLELNKLPFFLGREYYVLRSGRARMIIQADRADLGPAFTYLLFDAENARQSLKKETAYNFVPGEGFGASALVVELGGFPFTALGHRTETRWVVQDGVPAVEAVWWAGGMRVTERMSSLGADGLFQRSITLQGAHLVGEERVRLRLYLPQGEFRREGRLLLQNARGSRLALIASNGSPWRASAEEGTLELGPIPLGPDSQARLQTFLLAQIRPATSRFSWPRRDWFLQPEPKRTWPPRGNAGRPPPRSPLETPRCARFLTRRVSDWLA